MLLSVCYLENSDGASERGRRAAGGVAGRQDFCPCLGPFVLGALSEPLNLRIRNANGCLCSQTPCDKPLRKGQRKCRILGLWANLGPHSWYDN
jgi:hypothetical protein